MLSREFVLAGKAIFTVSNPHGAHYTYRVKQSRDKKLYFVSLFYGPNNETDYQYMGLLHSDGRVVLTKGSCKVFREESIPFRVINWALWHIWNSHELPSGYNIQHAGRCGRCGRLLTQPKSIELGLGPECAGLV